MVTYAKLKALRGHVLSLKISDEGEHARRVPIDGFPSCGHTKSPGAQEYTASIDSDGDGEPYGPESDVCHRPGVICSDAPLLNSNIESRVRGPS